MIAFQKFCQTQQTKMNGWMVGLIIFSLLGVVSAGLMLSIKGMGAFTSLPFIANILLQGSGSIMFLLFIRKISQQYINGYFFTPLTLSLIKTLAKLAMLFGLVIEPGSHIIFDYFSNNTDIVDRIGVVSYMQYVNLTLAVVGYALHLTSAVNKVSREFEAENSLTV
jgi:hypothetical protein